MTLKEIKKEVHHLDKTLKDEDDNDFKVAVVLLSSAIMGPNIKRLSKFTRYPRRWIAPLSRNMRKNKLWGKGVIYNDWFNKNGGIEFFLHCAVAQGLVECKEAPNDSP